MKNINNQTKICDKKDASYLNNATWTSFIFAFGKLMIVSSRINGSGTWAPEVICFDICQTIVLFVCAILIGCIAYNIKRNRIFVKANANLIKTIGFVIGISGPLAISSLVILLSQRHLYLISAKISPMAIALW